MVRMYRYKAQYSLDCENGIENAVLLKPQTPEMLLEEKQFQEQVYTPMPTGAVTQSLWYIAVRSGDVHRVQHYLRTERDT